MNADCAFWIGSTHRVCQDYALAVNEEAACVILADGCSSSPDTDIGARLLTRSALPRVPALPLAAPLEPGARQEWAAYHDGAIRAAADCAQRLGLGLTCLDATLLTIKAAGGAFVAGCSGDGVVALGRRDGRTEVYAVSFAANYPQYASYGLDAARRERWEAQPGNAMSVQKWVLGAEETEGEGEAQPSQGTCELFTGDAADYRFVAVLSDGVQSFARLAQTDTSRTTLPVTVVDVLAELLAFKGGGQGQFVQRRARAFGKACGARGWHHADDVAVGVVWLGD